MTGSQRHRDRLAMGEGALLSLAEAAALMPMADGEARIWLRQHMLVRHLEGRTVVIWGDVLNAIREFEQLEVRRTRRPRHTLQRVKLDP